MIEIKNVNKSFKKTHVLKNVSCTLEHGVYGLLGPNGAGKTTLMRCMTHLYNLNSGEILVDGVSIKKKKNDIGYLPQSFGLFKELSVWDSMNYFCNLKGIRKSARKEEIYHALQAVNLINSMKTGSGKLSGGMMRRVGVAQAILGKPELILFDEPTAGLDPEERMNFKRIVSNLGKDETVVISTHIVDDIEASCDHVIVMNEGRILYVGTCEELKDYAKGKVYECPQGAEHNLSGNYMAEKQYEKDGNIYYRLLAEPGKNLPTLEPTIEDGYMCIIKGI